MPKFTRALFFLLAAVLLFMPVNAQQVTVDPSSQFCFSSNDFLSEEAEDGIFITAVPSSNIANVCYGTRVLRPGDALSEQALNELTLQTQCVTTQSAQVEYCTVTDGKIAAVKTLKMTIKPPKNDPPVAKDSEFETYKNISNTGSFNASDPENKELEFVIDSEPKRGTVEIHDDGTFTYTPRQNKVGNDSFTYHAVDDAGNVSNTAKIAVRIKTPSSKETYADMNGRSDHFHALWLKEESIFSGASFGGQLCFQPEKTVSRGEFLVMVMKLVGADKNLITATSGFHDETETPRWMQPYISSALSGGMITGTNTENGVVFRPMDDMTKAEAAVLLKNVLTLPSEGSAEVFSSEESDALPAWAFEAFNALSCAGLDLMPTTAEETLTRAEAAELLYNVREYIDQATTEFHWQ